MSSGLECQFVERKPGEWFYLLEDSFNQGGWDWREDATAYGPFGSEEEARQHLSDNHSNPGGSMLIPAGSYREDAVYARLFDEASSRPKSRYIW